MSPAPDSTPSPPDNGALVLGWFTSPDAKAAAGRYLRRCGFPANADLIDDAIGDAAPLVLDQIRRAPGRHCGSQVFENCSGSLS